MNIFTLNRLLAADAVTSLAAGMLMVLAAAPLADWLNLPAPLLRGAGLLLLPWVVVLGLLARQKSPSRNAIWAVVAINAMWAIDSLVLLVSGWVAPNTLGTVFILSQAGVVGAFAVLQALTLPEKPLHLHT